MPNINTKRQVGEKCKITIRLAKTEKDVDGIIKLGKQMHAEGYYNKFPFNSNKLKIMAMKSLKDHGRRYTMIMAEQKNKLIGMLVAGLDRLFFSDAVISTTLLFYVEPSRRGSLAAIKLLDAYIRWSKLNGAVDIYIHVTSGVNLTRTDRFLRKCGFRQTGGNYALG